MRAAVAARFLTDEALRRQLHARISDYLESLNPNEPVVRLERMWQLIGERNAARTTAYYATTEASSPTPGEEHIGPNWTLVEWMAKEAHRATQRAPAEAGRLDWVLSWLEAVDLGTTQRYRVASNFMWGLHARLEATVGVGPLRPLAEAVERVLSRLAAADPGNAGWQRDLAVSHERLGDVLVAQGNLADALETFRRGVAVVEQLAAASEAPVTAEDKREFERRGANIPDDMRWRDEALETALSRCHENVAEVLVAQGNLTEALEAFRRGLALRSALAALDPTNVKRQLDLASSLSRVGDVLMEQGNLPGALEAFRRELGIAEQLAANAGNPASQSALSVSYVQVGNVLMRQRNLAGALEAFRRGLGIAQRLAAADPGNSGWQRDLSVTQSEVGQVLMAQGDLPGAVEAFRQGRATLELLAAADPGNAGWQRDLSLSHRRLGDALFAQRHMAEAHEAFARALAIAERLGAADPTNARWQQDLSTSHGNVAAVLIAQGRLAGALDSFQRQLAIDEALAAMDPTDAGHQHRLATGHVHVGEVLDAQGDLVGALAAFRRAVPIYERLAPTDPTNAECQHNLSASHDRVGDVLVAQGDLTGALEAFRQALTTTEMLAATDPTNPVWQHNLLASSCKCGQTLTALGNLAEGVEALRRGVAIAERLVAAEPEDANCRRDLAVAYLKLSSKLGSSDHLESLGWLRRGRDILRQIRDDGLSLDPNAEAVLEGLERMALPEALAVTVQQSGRSGNRGDLPSPPSGLASANAPLELSIPTPHPGADPERAFRLNIEYQRRLSAWKALPWLQRVRTVKPEPPSGI
jgi:tetratricopeptide (TPR) repeat protein